MVSQLTAAHLELVYEMRKRRELYPSVTRSMVLLEAIEWRIAREMIHRSKPPNEYTRRSRTRFMPFSLGNRKEKDRTLESSDPSKRRTHLVHHNDTDISDITFLPSNTERPTQTRAKPFEYVEVPPYRQLREERRIQGRMRKKPKDIWDLYNDDDVSAEYDVSLVGSPPPPSAIHYQGSCSIQGSRRQQSEKTLVSSDFFEAEKTDSGRGDGKLTTAKKDEEVRVKLRMKKGPQRHEQRRRSLKKKIMKEKDAPQSIAPNHVAAATFLEPSLEEEAMMPQSIIPGVATVEETLEGVVVPQSTAFNVAHGGERTLEATPPQPIATTTGVTTTSEQHTLAGMHAWSQQAFEKFAFSNLMMMAATESLLLDNKI